MVEQPRSCGGRQPFVRPLPVVLLLELFPAQGVERLNEKVDQGICRQYPAVPHPFVMTPPGDGQSEPRYSPGDAFSFGLTLIGHGLLYLAVFPVHL